MAKRTYGSMERMDTLMSSDSSPEMAESGSAAQCGAPLFGGDNTSLQGGVCVHHYRGGFSLCFKGK